MSGPVTSLRPRSILRLNLPSVADPASCPVAVSDAVRRVNIPNNSGLDSGTGMVQGAERPTDLLGETVSCPNNVSQKSHFSVRRPSSVVRGELRFMKGSFSAL